MAFPWSTKSDNAEPSSASPAAGSPDDVQEILQRLGQLGESLVQVNHALAAYFIEQQSHPVVVQGHAPSEGNAPVGVICERVAELAGKIDGMCRQGEAVSETVRQLQDQLDRGFQQMAELLQPQESNAASGVPRAACPPVSSPHGQQAARGARGSRRRRLETPIGNGLFSVPDWPCVPSWPACDNSS